MQSAGQLKLQIAKDERVQEIILGPKKDARRIKELRKGTCHIYIQGIGALTERAKFNVSQEEASHATFKLLPANPHCPFVLSF